MSPPSLISAEEEAKNSPASTSAAEQDCEVLQEKPKNIILDLISQFKNNLDLHKVTLPVFVLEPRSMLERITDFMSHQQLLFGLSQVQSAEERFLGVVRYFLSGWHVRPSGVRKPFNSVLGEHFRCKWSAFEDESTSFYFSEQVSHHPPISAFTLLNQKNCIFISGTVNPKSKFHGNSTSTAMRGETRVTFTNRPEEVYFIRKPTLYVRGLIFGALKMEIGDSATIECPNTGLTAEIQFKMKGILNRSTHLIQGVVRCTRTGKTIHHLKGKWDDKIWLLSPNQKEEVLFLDVKALQTCKPEVQMIAQQGLYESRRLWNEVSHCIERKDYDTAAKEKGRIEERQRRLMANSEAIKSVPVFYEAAEGGKWKEKFVANGYEGILELFEAGDVTSEVLKSFE